MTKPSIMIATPVYGVHDSASISVGHHMTVAGLIRDTTFTLGQAVFGTDIVRARSRLVRQFLTDTQCTHLLFWDADVSVPSVAQAARLIGYLLGTGKDLIGCTYPMKRVNWGRAAAAAMSGKDPQTAAYDYPTMLSEARNVTGGVLPVDGVPLGFCMLSRRMLEVMTERYKPTLGVSDRVDGQNTPVTLLFHLMIANNSNGDRDLLGEDYSFSVRARETGFQPYLYVGPDCELNHVGAMLFQGRREGFVK